MALVSLLPFLMMRRGGVPDEFLLTSSELQPYVPMEVPPENGESGLPFKKLRFSEPDLRVVLKYDDPDGDGAERAETTYMMYASSLAAASSFVDAALFQKGANGDPDRCVTFDDVAPDVFLLALNYLKDPVAGRSMLVGDVIKVAGFYRRYQFPVGSELCDNVLADYFDSQREVAPGDGPVVGGTWLLPCCLQRLIFSVTRSELGCIGSERNWLTRAFRLGLVR